MVFKNVMEKTHFTLAQRAKISRSYFLKGLRLLGQSLVPKTINEIMQGMSSRADATRGNVTHRVSGVLNYDRLEKTASKVFPELEKDLERLQRKNATE